MAIVTKTYYVSDVSKTEIDEKDLARAEITWKGKTYNLATNKDEMERVAEYINDLVDGAEEVPDYEVTVSRTRSKAASSSRSNLPAGHTLDDVRTWANRNGHDVADRGRIAKRIEAEYKQANNLTLSPEDRVALSS